MHDSLSVVRLEVKVRYAALTHPTTTNDK